jgi:hypothetical protein
LGAADVLDTARTGGTGGIGGSGGAPGTGGTGGAGTDPELVLWYKFDESTGTTAADSAMFGGTARNATLEALGTGGSAGFSTTKQVGTHAVKLTPSASSPNANGAYIKVPSLQDLAPGALTIAVWVNLATASTTQSWERIFDFGTGTQANSFLCLVAHPPSNDTTSFSFAIAPNGYTANPSVGQTLTSPGLTSNVWHHLAIVLPAGASYTGILYVDGARAAINSAMSLHAADIGATTNNWLGRSQVSTDPLFNGLMDDFRVYRRVLSPQEISDLFAAH